jgi:hypothetical protein
MTVATAFDAFLSCKNTINRCVLASTLSAEALKSLTQHKSDPPGLQNKVSLHSHTFHR